jgi:hypothetical protein
MLFETSLSIVIFEQRVIKHYNDRKVKDFISKSLLVGMFFTSVTSDPDSPVSVTQKQLKNF